MNDLILAKNYLRKAQSSESRGVLFTLSITSYKNLTKAKKCYYTGLPLSDSTRTIDRVDRCKGYEKGNVVSCHTSVNSLKNVMEQPTIHGVTQKSLLKLISKWAVKVN